MAIVAAIGFTKPYEVLFLWGEGERHDRQITYNRLDFPGHGSRRFGCADRKHCYNAGKRPVKSRRGCRNAFG